MNHPREAHFREQFAAINETEGDKLADLGRKYAALKALTDEVGREAKAAGKALLEAMEEQGLHSMDVGVAKIGISQRYCVGIAEGTQPEDRLRHMEEAREWVEKYNPTQPNITTTNLKTTLEAYREIEGADAPLPKFLKDEDVPSLSVRRTKK